MEELIKELREDIKLCDFDDGCGYENKDSVKEALATLDRLEKQLIIHSVVVPKGTLCQTPKQCETSYYHQISDYYCRKCGKTGLA